MSKSLLDKASGGASINLADMALAHDKMESIGKRSANEWSHKIDYPITKAADDSEHLLFEGIL